MAKTPQTPSIFIEGNACEFPMWSYSKQKSAVKELKINYPDGSFMEITAANGLPGPQFAGYLDVLLAHGQEDLFGQNYIEMSVYDILKTLGKDPTHSGNYRKFRADMKKCFNMSIVTDRFVNPKTGTRDFTEYFRIMDRMKIAHHRNKKSRFYFNEVFLESIRAGYLKHLDYDFCLELDQENQSLARFVYQHVSKRLGKNMYYIRNLDGFLTDIGLENVTKKTLKYKNEYLKKTFYPALDRIAETSVFRYELADNKRNIVFYSPNAKKTIDEYRDKYRKDMIKKKADRAMHEKFAACDPSLYVKHVNILKKNSDRKDSMYFDDIYQSCLMRIQN